MNESIVITHSLEDDTRCLDLPFLNASFETDGALVSEFPWYSYPTDSVSCDHDRCSPNPVKRELLTPTEYTKPYTAPDNAFDMVFGLGNDSAEPVSSAPGQAITQLAGQTDARGLVADCCFSSHNDVDNGVVHDDSIFRARDMTSSEPSHHTSPSSPSPSSPSSSAPASALSSSSSSSPPSRRHNNNNNNNNNNNRKSMTILTTPAPDDDVNVNVNANVNVSVKQHREKNRVAARKCRQKAKRNVAALQRRERELSQRNRELLGHVGSLRDEVLDLKDEVLRHADCGSDVIQNYIANAARLQLG